MEFPYKKLQMTIKSTVDTESVCRCQKKNGTLEEKSFGYTQHRLLFSKAMEKQLVEYLITAPKTFHGLTMEELQELAFELAEASNLSMLETWKANSKAGIEWAREFIRRHQDEISLRTPEATSPLHMSSFNKHNVNIFYDDLEEVIMQKGFTPERI
ncbi:transposase [Plakobranchus ocellatus]|uniref:Transposase n=1 Tax=Plakobranchus ocellatus TaxID=259542 RepID=A0AAV4BUT7_9GAST|nr:transposase [Plakobranchus ocellatus]